MQVGDLVKHKRTGALGLLLYVPKRAHYGDWWFDVQWYDGRNQGATNHVKGELVVVSHGQK